MNSKKHKIELLGVSGSSKYSLAKIHIAKQGDVYFCPKLGDDFHYSRHRDGNSHFKSRNQGFSQKTGAKVEINDFSGIEQLLVQGINLNERKPSMIWKKSSLKSHDDVWEFSLDQYSGLNFNLALYILSNDTATSFYETHKSAEIVEYFLYSHSDPLVGVALCGYEINNSSPNSV